FAPSDRPKPPSARLSVKMVRTDHDVNAPSTAAGRRGRRPFHGHSSVPEAENCPEKPPLPVEQNGSMSPRKKRTPDEAWRKTLTEGHRPLRVGRAIFGRVPSAPRC